MTEPIIEVQHHRSVVEAYCPEGHLSKTQKASGSPMLCGRCRERGRQTIITVPLRPGETEPERAAEPVKPKPVKPPKAPKTPRPPERLWCRGCNRLPAVKPDPTSGRPYGWLALSVRVPPEASSTGKPYVWVGQWCSIACLARSVPSLALSERNARKALPADPPGMLREDGPAVRVLDPFGDGSGSITKLMTEVPGRVHRLEDA